jgi:pimeloyl-ACP methyl ester carboxylesterase
MFRLLMNQGGIDVADPERNRLLFLHDADVLPGHVGALARLADSVDLEVPRHPGFGENDDLAQDWDCIADVAQYYLHRLDLADGPAPHLAGAGLGGWIALEMAVRAQARFGSLTLVAPYGVKLFGRMDREFADILLLDPTEVVELGWANPTACHSMRMPGFPPGLDDSQYARAFEDRATIARLAWRPFLHDPRLRRWLHVLDLPTLVIAGHHDRLVRPQHSRRLAELIPGARFVELPDSGHYPYLETQDNFTDTVLSFVDGNRMIGATQ